MDISNLAISPKRSGKLKPMPIRIPHFSFVCAVATGGFDEDSAIVHQPVSGS
jgi:hypothetical protein